MPPPKEPDMMELHHLAIGSSNVERIAAFYREIFSLPELERYTYSDGSLRSIWLDVNGTILMIEHTREAPRSVDGVAAGPFLLAFRIVEENYEEFLARLEENDIPVEDETEHTAYFRDPEGNRLAVSHYPRD